MTHRNIKVGVTATVLVGALVGLLWSTLRDGTQYYKHVDEVMASPQNWEGKHLQLHGFVVPGSVVVKQSTLEYQFKVQNNGSVVPDTFKNPGAEVVLTGRLTPAGFHTDPNGVMAKCPSKYESAKKAG